MTALTHQRSTTAALTGLAALALGSLLTATASSTWAAESSTPPAASPSSSTEPGTDRPTVTVEDGTVTLTLDSAKVEALCARVPAAQQRVAALVTRINAGSEVSGSVAAVQERAAAARAAGRESVADRLDLRSERRAGRLDELRGLADRLTAAEASICVPLAAQLGDGA